MKPTRYLLSLGLFFMMAFTTATAQISENWQYGDRLHYAAVTGNWEAFSASYNDLPTHRRNDEDGWSPTATIPATSPDFQVRARSTATRHETYLLIRLWDQTPLEMPQTVIYRLLVDYDIGLNGSIYMEFKADTIEVTAYYNPADGVSDDAFVDIPHKILDRILRAGIDVNDLEGLYLEPNEGEGSLCNAAPICTSQLYGAAAAFNTIDIRVSSLQRGFPPELWAPLIATIRRYDSTAQLTE